MLLPSLNKVVTYSLANMMICGVSADPIKKEVRSGSSDSVTYNLVNMAASMQVCIWKGQNFKILVKDVLLL